MLTTIFLFHMYTACAFTMAETCLFLKPGRCTLRLLWAEFLHKILVKI